MSSSAEGVLRAIKSGNLARVLRGEECVFVTPSGVNDDMRPTDHAELLEFGLYPLAREIGADVVRGELERGLRSICSDALGVYCAHQCFYIELVYEKEGRSPLFLDRGDLPKFLAECFIREGASLASLELMPGDAVSHRPYRVTLSGMRILARDYGIDWGVELPRP